MRSILKPALLLCLSFPALAAAQDGDADLNEATELKLNASTPRDLDKVADLCESAIAKGLDAESEKFARQLWASALYEYASVLSQQFLDTIPRPQRWQFWRGQALNRLRKAVELAPEMADAHFLIARMNLLERGDREEATSSLQKLIELSTDNPSQLSRAYMLRAQTKNDDEQLADLNLATETDPSNTIAIRMLGAYYLTHDQPDKAVESFRKLAEVEPNDPQAQYLVAQTLLGIDQPREALVYADKAIELNPDFAATYTLRAQIRRVLEEDQAAMEDVETALKKNPRDIDALLLRASVLYEEQEFEKALRDVEAALAIRPLLIRGIYMRSFILAAQDKFDAAIEDMELLAENEPENHTWQMDLAMLYNAAERPRKAIQLYDGVIDQQPENARALRGRGDARLSTGEHAEAIADYEAALKLEPEDSGLLNNFAWVLATSPQEDLRNGQRAIELGIKACELTEYKQAHILSTLAAGYAETGDFEKAIEWATKAVEAGEGDQVEDLNKELESYRQGNPWREKKTVEEPEGGGGSFKSEQNEQQEKSDKGKNQGDQGNTPTAKLLR